MRHVKRIFFNAGEASPVVGGPARAYVTITPVSHILRVIFFVQAGATDYLSKPVALSQLPQTCRKTFA
jgi:hypothetical protein